MSDLSVRSMIEEGLAALYLIAALLAWGNGLRVFAWVLFAKAAFDTLAAIAFAAASAASKKEERNDR